MKPTEGFVEHFLQIHPWDFGVIALPAIFFTQVGTPSLATSGTALIFTHYYTGTT